MKALLSVALLLALASCATTPPPKPCPPKKKEHKVVSSATETKTTVLVPSNENRAARGLRPIVDTRAEDVEVVTPIVHEPNTKTRIVNDRDGS